MYGVAWREALDLYGLPAHHTIGYMASHIGKHATTHPCSPTSTAQIKKAKTAPLEIPVPPGTVVKRKGTGALLGELLQPGGLTCQHNWPPSLPNLPDQRLVVAPGLACNTGITHLQRTHALVLPPLTLPGQRLVVVRGGAGGHGVVSPSREQNKARQSRAERAARVRAGRAGLQTAASTVDREGGNGCGDSQATEPV